jgi:hypothetical protein
MPAQERALKSVKTQNVYLEQSIYGQMLDVAADWRTGEIASLLLDAQAARRAQIWAGPTHVMETVQTQDIDRRRRLAQAVLELIEFRRTWWGYEFEVVSEFFGFVETIAPGTIRTHHFFDHHASIAREQYLGALALIVAVTTGKFEVPIAALQHAKASSQLLHARFAIDPEKWINRMIEVVDKEETKKEQDFEGPNAMTIEQMETEITALQNSATKLSKRALQKLNSNRDRICKAYSAMEVGPILSSIFTLPLELEVMFDIPKLVTSLKKLETEWSRTLLEREVREAQLKDFAANPRLTRATLQAAIRAATQVGIPTSYIGFQIVLRELQQCFNRQTLPTGGLTFDVQHAGAIAHFDIVMTTDATLAGNLKTMANYIEKRSKGARRCAIVTDGNQLRKALAS